MSSSIFQHLTKDQLDNQDIASYILDQIKGLESLKSIQSVNQTSTGNIEDTTDVEALISETKIIADKLQHDLELSSSEKQSLITILRNAKLILLTEINRGNYHGSTTGLDSYVNKLKA